MPGLGCRANNFARGVYAEFLFRVKCIETFKADNKVYEARKAFKVQMKCFFFIAEFERAAKIRKIAVYRFLTSLLVPEL